MTDHTKEFGDTIEYGDTRRDDKQRVRVWTKCKECGKDFWSLGYDTCIPCAFAPGAEYLDSKRKLYIRLAEDDPYYDMTFKQGYLGNGWTAKARYIMAQHLGRCLDPWEQVHHRDGNKKNFAIENLMLRKTKPKHGETWEGD